ncbi:Hypothetical predicted protein [Pelobates cultripes]|uniref:Uncharacterized protein n=1 Tax=Pelobates cultripes TaxID=61616 RepID=A0AAD1QXT8_PELCU|nr:Hypothetical predicted protein [Pelobates cultripes]
MCPPRGREGGGGVSGGGLWERRVPWERLAGRWLQPRTLLVAALFALGASAVFCFPLLSACALCVSGCWVYRSSGRRLLVLAGLRPPLGPVQARPKRQRPYPARRLRDPHSFRWSPADLLLLMGSYLGKQDPPARGQVRGPRDIKERLARPNPEVATPARRLSFRETPVHNRAYMSPRRHYPTHQPQYSMTGSLPMVFMDGHQEKTVVSPKKYMLRSPVTVRIPPADKSTAYSFLDNVPPRCPVSPTRCAPDPCAKETVLSAIKESRKRLNKDEENALFGDLDSKRRRYGSGPPLEPPVANGLLSSFAAKDIPDRAYVNRRYPIHQPQYSKVGSLPLVSLDGYQKKPVLSPKNAYRPGIVRIPPPDKNIANVIKNMHCSSMSLPHRSPDPCAKETVLNALKECRKRLNKDDDCTIVGDLDNKRRRHGGDPTSEPPEANGLQATSVFKSDNLKRGQSMQSFDEDPSKRSRTSSSSSVTSNTMNGIQLSAHNAITSSYSSSKKLLKERMALLNKSASSSSSRCQTPEWPIKKGRQDLHTKSPVTPLKSNSRLNSSGQFTDTPVSKGLSTISTSPTGNVVAGRRSKVLLTCPERNEPYHLPPAPIVGYEVTTEDYDAEKKAALQRLHRALEDLVPTTSAPSSIASSVFTLPTTASSTFQQASVASNSSLMQSLAKMQEKEKSPALGATAQSTAEVATTVSKVSNLTFAFAANSSSSGLQSAISNTTPNLVTPAVTSISTPVFPQPLGTTHMKPQSPKNGLLLQMLSKPEDNAQTAFKPIFGAPPSENSISLAATPVLPVSTVASATFKPVFGNNLEQQTPASETTFKPIFGASGTQPPASSAPFSFQMASKSSTSTPAFPGISVTDNAPKTTPVLSAHITTTTNSSTGSAFQFGAASQCPTTSSAAAVLGSNSNKVSQAKPAISFGQTAANAQNSGFTGFGSASAASTTQPKPSTAFGSTTSAFTATFGSNNSFPGNSGTPAFTSGAVSEAPASKSTTTPIPNFGSGTPAFGSSTQPGFASNVQPAFGASVQPTFGTTNTTFSFGNSAPAATKATTFGSISNSQTSSSTPSTNMFAGASSTPFSFGVASNSAASFGSGSQSANTAGNTGFNFGAASTAAPAASFGSSNATQNSTGTPAQNSTFAFGTPGATEIKSSFGTSTPAFGQTTPTAGLTFGSPAPGFPNASPSFSPATPSFSIGAGSKPTGVRQRLMARRQHARKK